MFIDRKVTNYHDRINNHDPNNNAVRIKECTGKVSLYREIKIFYRENNDTCGYDCKC
jgi:hypothetical protein